MKGLIKVPRIMLLMGVIVAGLMIMAFVFRGSALAQSSIPSVAVNQVLLNQAKGLIYKVSITITAEQSIGHDTSQLQAALADLEQIVYGSTTSGEQTIEGNGTRKSPIVTDYSERTLSRDPQRALQLSYNQLKQIFDTFKAAYPYDFALRDNICSLTSHRSQLTNQHSHHNHYDNADSFAALYRGNYIFEQFTLCPDRAGSTCDQQR